MASDFQAIMHTGGLKVGITGLDPNQMIIVSENIREGIEVKKFATQMESVRYVEIDQIRTPGKHITKEEAKSHGLRMPDEHDEL